jgi:hypothetical protein
VAFCLLRSASTSENNRFKYFESLSFELYYWIFFRAQNNFLFSNPPIFSPFLIFEMSDYFLGLSGNLNEGNDSLGELEPKDDPVRFPVDPGERVSGVYGRPGAMVVSLAVKGSPKGTLSSHGGFGVGLEKATGVLMGSDSGSGTLGVGENEGSDMGHCQVNLRGSFGSGGRQKVGWGTSIGRVRKEKGEKDGLEQAPRVGISAGDQWGRPPTSQVCDDSHEVEVDYGDENEGEGMDQEESDGGEDERGMKLGLKSFISRGLTSNKKPKGNTGERVRGSEESEEQNKEGESQSAEGDEVTQPQEGTPEKEEVWRKIMETDCFPVGDVLLRLIGEATWEKGRACELCEGWFKEVENAMRYSLRVMVPNKAGQEFDEMDSVREGIPNFWMLEGLEEAVLGEEGEDWMGLGDIVSLMEGNFIRIQVSEGWMLRCTDEGAGELIREAVEEIRPLVKEFCMEVYKKTEVLVEAAPGVVAASTAARWGGKWVVITGLGEGFPGGVTNKKDEDRLVTEVLRATKDMGDGVVLKVDQADLRARARDGKVFFYVRGKDLGDIGANQWKMTLVRLMEEAMVGVDIKGEGKALLRVDTMVRDAKKVYFRQVIRDEDGAVCLSMMEEQTDTVDNFVMGIRGFIKFDEFDEYLRANMDKVVARMGLNTFGLMVLVQRTNGEAEMVMLVLSKGKIGGSRMRGAFGYKRGDAFDRVGIVVAGLTAETFISGSQVIGGRDIIQDGPVIEIEGPGAYGMGMNEVTTVLAKYGELGVVGMAKYVLSVQNRIAKWKVFVGHDEWKGLLKLNAKKPNGYGVTLAARFSAWAAREKPRFGGGIPERHAWERKDKVAFIWDGVNLTKRLVQGGAGVPSPAGKKEDRDIKGLKGIEKRTKGTTLGDKIGMSGGTPLTK